MKIEGKLIAQEIRQDLKKRVISLKSKNILPHLAVILVGNDLSSQTYVRQKEKVGYEIGVKVSIFNFQFSIFKNELINLVNKLNSDKSVHGIIIQRPLPLDITKEELDNLVISQKDVDGFHPKSAFTPPIASAVLKILEWVFCHSGLDPESHGILKQVQDDKFTDWLKIQRILVIGRGETAGKPIADTLIKINPKLTIAHSQTTNLKEVCLSSDIIITCVGRPNIVRHNMVSDRTVLVGVGLHPEENKLQTDYIQEEIADKVAYYTPVPGGVGPVNVACLFENLLIAAS